MDLPLPIATLLRRARNAKSPKERHDTAYFAWEASIRLAVAARPPADVAGLVLPSTGHWVGGFRGSDALLDRPALLAAFALLSDVGLGRKAPPKAVTAKALLEPFAAYRNHVIGHGSTRAAEFYDRAAGALLDGLEAAWAAGVFWPDDARLVFVDSIEIDAAGGRRARTLALSGLAPALEGSPGGGGAIAPEGALPRRLYLRAGGQLRSLHPWLLYQEAELRERVLFFNGRARTAQFLDYVSGEALKGKALAEAFPALEADLDALFTRALPAGEAAAAALRQVQDERTEAADPSRFGDYRLLGKLGAGGMGVVYLARQEGLGRVVALKMLPLDAAQDPVAVARFKREVAALSRCDHPNVIKIHASGEAQGTHYYAMELVEGADLAQVAEALSSAGDNDFDGAVSTASERVRRAKSDAFAHVPDVGAAGGGAGASVLIAGRAKDRARRLAALFRDAARGVHHLHEVGVIHRDLKPGNLMVTAVDHRVVVMDLGLAALGDASQSITKDRSALLGTLRYMPPEQLQRNLVALDRRADVYSLGATLYELVTDRKFLDGDSEARLVEQVLRETPMPAERAGRSVPRDLSVIIQKATEKDPARRYESAAALAADLDAFVEGRPIAARAPTLRYILRLAVARHKALAATVALGLGLAVAGTAFFVAREGRLRREAEEQRAEAVQQRAEALRLGRLAEEREREAQTERGRAEQRAREANGNLAAVFMEKTDRALAGRDVLAAQVLSARALSLADGPEARGILLDTRSTVRMLWATPSRPATISEALAFSPDGRLLASGGTDAVVRLWDLAAGEVLRSLAGHEGGVHALAFSPDGSRLASGGADRMVRVWDMATGGLLHELRGHEGAVFSVAFGPAGRLASGGADGAIVLWDAEKGTNAHTFRYHKDAVWCVAVSGDGRRLASGGRDRTIGVVDLEDRREWGNPFASPRWTLGAGPDASVAFSLDGRRLAFGGKDGGTRVYDVDSKGPPVLTLPAQDSSLGLAFSPDGRRLACAGGDAARVVEVDGGKEVHAEKLAATCMTLSPDGGRMAIASADQTIRLFDVGARAEVAALRPEGAGCLSLAFSADGRLIAAGGRDRATRLLDAATGQEVRVLRGHRSWVSSVAFDGGGRLASCASGEVLTWDPSSAEPRGMEIPGVTRPATIAWSPDGRRLAAARADGGGVDLIDLRGGPQGEGPSGAVLLRDDDEDGKGRATSLAFSDDGALLQAGYSDGMTRVWDVSTRRRIDRVKFIRLVTSGSYKDEPVLAVGFGRDGKRIFWGAKDFVGQHSIGSDMSHFSTPKLSDVTAFALAPGGRYAFGLSDGTVVLGRLRSDRLAGARRGHGAAVRSLAFSRDGHRLVSGADDHSVRLWSVEEGRETFDCMDRLVGAAVMPSGRCLVVGRDDGATQLVDIETGALQAPTDTSRWGAQQGVVGLALAPGGRRAATPAKDRTVAVHEVESGRPLVTYHAHEHEATCAAFSPDGRWLASGGLDQRVRLHDLDEIGRPAPPGGQPGVPPLRPGAAVACLAWGRGGDRLVTGGADGRIKVFDLETRREVQALGGHEGPVLTIAVLSAADRIVSAGADGTVRLWDLAAGKEAGVLASGTKGVRSIASSPSGAWLVLGGSDGVARVLDLASGRELLTLRRQGGGAAAAIVAVGFTPEGGRLIVTSEDGTVRVMDVAGLERFLAAAPERLLSEAEGDTGLRVEGIDPRVIPDHRVVRTGATRPK